MTYPTGPLNWRIRIAPGADLTAAPSTYTWTDITTDVDSTFDITDVIGAGDDASETNSSLSFSLRNTSGRYTTDNPESDLWPFFDIGCPIEYAIDNGDGAGYRIQVVVYLGSAVDSWPAGTQYRCTTTVVGGGLFRRLGLIGTKINSAITRTVLSTRRAGYWPLYDLAGATSAVALTPGTAPLIPQTGVLPDFGTTALVAGSAGAVTMRTGSQLYAAFVAPTMGTVLRMSFVVFANTPPPGEVELLDLRIGGGAAARLVFNIGPNFARVRAYSAAGTELTGAATAGFTQQNQDPTWVDVDFTQSGSNINWTIFMTNWLLNPDGSVFAISTTIGGSFAGALGQAYGIDIAPNRDVDDVIISDLVLTDTSVPGYGGTAAVAGWAGNTAAGRIKGMADEFKIPATVTSTALGSLMGPQLQDTLLANWRDAAGTDHGVLSDHTGVVTYRALSELYNQAPVFSLSRTVRGEIAADFEPVRDDQDKVNVATASRTNGSSFTARDDADVARAGAYDRGGITVNAAADTQLPGHAGWALARGIAARKRIATVTLKMHLVSSALGTSALAVNLGDRLTFSSLPPQMAKGGLTQQIRGRTQVVNGRRKWSITYNLVPVDPYQAFILDTDRLDTAGTEIVQAATSTATGILTVTAGALPATGATSVSLSAAGEQVTLTNVTTETPIDPFTRTAATWGSFPATTHLPALTWTSSGIGGFTSTDCFTDGSGVHLVQTANAYTQTTLGGLTMINPDVSAMINLGVVATGTGGLEANIMYRRVGTTQYSARLLFEVGNTIRLLLYAPGDILIANVLTGLVHTAGQTLILRSAPIGARHRIRVWVLGEMQPDNWNVDTYDTSRLKGGIIGIRSGRQNGNTNTAPVRYQWDDVTINNMQWMDVTRSVNGMVKALKVGDPVKLWDSRGLGV